MKLHCLYFLSSILMLSCTKTPQTATISFNMETNVLDEIVITNSVDMKYDTVRALQGGVLKWEVEDGGELVKMIAGRQQQLIYLSPGDDLTIAFNDREGLTVNGGSEKERILLESFDKEYSIASTKYGIVNIGDQEPDAFLSTLDEKFQKLNSLLEKSESEGSSLKLISMLRTRISAAKANDIYDYPNYYKYKKGRDVQLDEAYYSNADDFDINDELAYNFPDMKFIGLGIATKEVNYDEYEEVADYSKAQLQEIEKSVSNPKVVEILKYNVLMNKINYSGGAGGMEKEIEAFISSTKDGQKISQLKADVAKWAHLQVGLRAPEFSAFTRAGEEVKLSELKGKNVYIDVWATWCGPCIAEIPALKKAEQEYHHENVEFVSVSIDALKDKEKWMKMVQDRELGGTQIMAENAWQSEITKQYNISGIPRFIFVNAEGLIVSADAPRPSNEVKFNKMLEGALN